jgi:hypothetical protein
MHDPKEFGHAAVNGPVASDKVLPGQFRGADIRNGDQASGLNKPLGAPFFDAENIGLASPGYGAGDTPGAVIPIISPDHRQEHVVENHGTAGG